MKKVIAGFFLVGLTLLAFRLASPVRVPEQTYEDEHWVLYGYYWKGLGVLDIRERFDEENYQEYKRLMSQTTQIELVSNGLPEPFSPQRLISFPSIETQANNGDFVRVEGRGLFLESFPEQAKILSITPAPPNVE
jgi:hypothetical protein